MNNSENKPLRVAAYARVSTDKDDQINSLESQIKYFTDYIQSHENWSLVKVYCDKGISGTTTAQRVGFNEMLNDAYSGKIDLIITKEVSRFARNTVDTLKTTRDLKELGIGVKFLLDNINTFDGDGELRLTIMASLAQEESRKISERVKWGQKRQMEKGVVFGRSLFGYSVNNGKLTVIPEEADVVRTIFHKFVYECKGAYIIARELNDGRVTPLKSWNTVSVMRILKNEKYVGDLAQKKTVTKSYLDHKRSINKDEIIYIKNHHPNEAVITRKMWNAAQNEITRRAKFITEKSKYSNRYWASGKIRCGACGEIFIRKIKGNLSYWCCLNHVKAKNLRKSDCDLNVYVSDRSLKDAVLALLENLICDKPEIINEIINSIDNVKNDLHTIDKNKICLKIKQLEKKKTKLIDIRIADELSQDDFLLKKEQIDAEIKKLRSELKEKKENGTIFFEIEKIFNFKDRNIDSVLSSVVESITIINKHIILIKLTDIPLVFKVKFSSNGRLNAYITDILSIDLVSK